MIDFRSVYRHAEEHTNLLVGGLFCLLVLLIVLQSIFSPGFVMVSVLCLIAVVIACVRPLWILGFLSIYFPFESIILKFTPNEVYFFTRYVSEGLIYLVAGVVLIGMLLGRRSFKSSPIDTPFVLLVVSMVASALINFVPPSIAILGIRQILRFVIVFFLVVQLRPTAGFIRNLTITMLGIVLFQSVLGIMQSFIGQPLDDFFLPSVEHTIGSILLTGATEQFWDPGSRVFATLGRYDRLGNFLYIFLLIASGFLFIKQRSKQITALLPWVFLLGLPTLMLTYSRASWFAFLLGFLFIGIYILRDRRVAIGFFVFVTAMMLVLGSSGLQVALLTESSGQTLTERFFESFSYARWSGEYYGLGRTFWFVHTPLNVVAAAPIFGWGPGQFGGGAAAALGNTTAYEAVDLPFGVFGTEGFIDNNWFSLWGELGTLGIVLYLCVFFGLFVFAMKHYIAAKDPFTKALLLGFSAIVVAVTFNAFTSTLLEIRTVAFYFWLYAGFVVVLARKES